MSLLAPGIPLSLYIHLPWCVEKCPYCDFNSHQLNDQFDETKYVASLLKDLEQDLPKIWGRAVETIFIGGGTPSLFSGPAIDELISGVRARLMLRADLEITLESNPGTADAQNYLNYRQAGVNRLSIGVQSFDDQQLKILGRIHDASQAVDAFQMARDAGFKRINIDLMYALPAQSIEDALKDLDKAIALDPEHISWYQLTIEPNTTFNRYPPKQLPDDDLIWEIQQAGAKKLQEAGFTQYEISAWSKKSEQCQHNVNYWEFGDYLGIGAGAHGKITDLSNEKIYRTRRRKQPSHWLDDKMNFLADAPAIEKTDLPLEFMMNAMRLNSGVSISTFTERTGLLISDIMEPLRKARNNNLMDTRLDILKPTPQGLNYLNDLLALFMDVKITQTNDIVIKEIT
ncbi:MAG: putative oxygen-independent coproporphyrinogen III oxidase [Enterobacterales bacterium]|jgi:putative oxygen-independent coproporphyrinogen III oxidase